MPAVRADEDALVTALLNLLDNAYKYSPGEKRIRLRAACEDGHVIFAVTDQGIGIAAREQKRIFRPLLSGGPPSRPRIGRRRPRPSNT